MKYHRRKIDDHCGHTLVEVMIALFCSSVIICGLAGVYAYGLKEYAVASSRIQMFNEGNIILGQIENLIRRSENIYVIENNDPNRTELYLTIANTNNNGGVVELFTNRRDRTLRMNDWRMSENIANIRLLPIRIFRNYNQPIARFPYRVLKMHFQYGDDEIDGYEKIGSPYLIRIDMVLEDTLGNTVNLSSTQSKLN